MNKQPVMPAFDPVIHPIQRLRICAFLAPVRDEEFSALRDLLGTSDSALSKQLSTLDDAGYVALRRAARGGRSRVWVSLTVLGRRAFRQHVAALNELAGAAAATTTANEHASDS